MRKKWGEKTNQPSSYLVVPSLVLAVKVVQVELGMAMRVRTWSMNASNIDLGAALETECWKRYMSS